jgi:Ser/Thr protein kinase RdoA (MazF antagonist)
VDFTPRNLLCDAQGGVSMIDFEHARYDLAARDLVRLSDRVWRGRPDLPDAFFTGYGLLSDFDCSVIEHCIYLDTLITAVRATGRTLPVGAPT